MARNYTGGTPEQKEFVKLFQSLAGKYSLWEVWKDFVWMYAIAISNAVDKRFYESREKTYRELASKYTKAEMEKFPQLYIILIDAMDRQMNIGRWGDFLGELFMNLDLGNNLGGQFFTPYNVCYMMAKITADSEDGVKQAIKDNGWAAVNDCACGAGATLIAAAETLKEAGVNYQRDVLFTAQDIDSTTALMCYIQLSLLGCPGYVKIGDTMSDPMTGNVLYGGEDSSYWFTPMFFSEPWEARRTMETCKSIFQWMGRTASPMAANDAPGQEEPQEAATPPHSPPAPEEPPQPERPTRREESAPAPPRRRRKQPTGQLSLFDL